MWEYCCERTRKTARRVSRQQSLQSNVLRLLRLAHHRRRPSLYLQQCTMEDILNTVVPAEHLEHCEKVKTTFATLSNSMKAVCSVYHTDFRQLTECHEIKTGESLLGYVDLVLTNPPCNIRSSAGKEKSENDLLHWEDIRGLVQLCSEVMVSLVHGHKFRASLHFLG